MQRISILCLKNLWLYCGSNLLTSYFKYLALCLRVLNTFNYTSGKSTILCSKHTVGTIKCKKMVEILLSVPHKVHCQTTYSLRFLPYLTPIWERRHRRRYRPRLGMCVDFGLHAVYISESKMTATSSPFKGYSEQQISKVGEEWWI